MGGSFGGSFFSAKKKMVIIPSRRSRFEKKNLNVPLVLVDIIIVDMYIYIADSNVLPINEFQQQCQVNIYIYEDAHTDTHTNREGVANVN